MPVVCSAFAFVLYTLPRLFFPIRLCCCLSVDAFVAADLRLPVVVVYSVTIGYYGLRCQYSLVGVPLPLRMPIVIAPAPLRAVPSITNLHLPVLICIWDVTIAVG